MDRIIAAEVSNPQALQKPIEEFRGFASCLEKEIICGTGVWNIGNIRQSDAMSTAHQMHAIMKRCNKEK